MNDTKTESPQSGKNYRMSEEMERVNDDPIYDIRVAVANVLRAYKVPGDHKRLTDAVTDELPDFFRQSLQPAD